MKESTNTGLFILSIALILFAPMQDEWMVLFISWLGAGLAYFTFLRDTDQYSIRDILFLALLIRVLAVFSIPNLSDDFTRFIWDGTVLVEGANPYLHKPNEWLAQHQIDSYRTLFNQLNSPHYYSVYTPLLQFFFGLSALLQSVYSSVLMLKGILLSGELLTLYLLHRMLLPNKRPFLLYALNPLVIIEGIGNIHFEILAITFIVLAIWFLKKKNWRGMGFSLGSAIAVKLNPLLFIPLSVRYFLQNRVYRVMTWSVITGIILLSPLVIWGAWSEFLQSIRLYFQTFEFNAGLYYLLREWLWQWTGYNPIGTLGPAMGLMALLIILIIGLYPGRMEWRDCLKRWQWGFLVYLLASTTIHPWYILPLILLSCFTGLIFPIVWSFLIFLTYSHYGNIPPNWFWSILTIEYAGLIIAILWDIKKRPEEGFLPDASN